MTDTRMHSEHFSFSVFKSRVRINDRRKKRAVITGQWPMRI